jgi:hypothetical protein
VSGCAVTVRAESAAGAPLGGAEREMRPATSRVLRLRLTRAVGIAVLRITRVNELAAGGRQIDERIIRVRTRRPASR